MGKVKVLQFFVEIISHKTVVIIIELQMNKPQKPSRLSGNSVLSIDRVDNVN